MAADDAAVSALQVERRAAARKTARVTGVTAALVGLVGSFVLAIAPIALAPPPVVLIVGGFGIYFAVLLFGALMCVATSTVLPLVSAAFAVAYFLLLMWPVTGSLLLIWVWWGVRGARARLAQRSRTRSPDVAMVGEVYYLNV
jgi:hypothetical protein